MKKVSTEEQKIVAGGDHYHWKFLIRENSEPIYVKA